VSMHALRAGALTVLSKPSGPAAPNFEEAKRQFVATVKAMSQVKVVRHWRPRPAVEAPPASAPGAHGKVRILAIAASTGGPGALSRLLSELPGDFPVPILLVQHMALGFGEGFVAWLNTALALNAKVAENGEPLSPGTVYVAPDDRHLGVSERSTIALSSAPPLAGFRPSGTFLFQSVAKAFGPSAVAVVLTGMGQDGAEGVRQIREFGGRVIAQDEETSVVFGMPKAAIATGSVEDVLPLQAIASRILGLARGAGGPP
ncbi:MAG TPA: chemotaxis protein CheB, partial [Planctomycetota bacterium]|nr:chemotaxis protein CheB [Planctomycetota bacterium]